MVMKLDGEMPKREVLISKLAKKLAKEGSASLDYKESQDYKRAEGPSRDEHRPQPQHIASFNQATYSSA